MTATPAQFDFIRSLIAQREISADLSEIIAQARALATQGALSRAQASSLIDLLKEAPLISLEGMHQLPSGEIYKVQIAHHGSGHAYAKRLTVTNGEAHFEIARGAIRMLSLATRMSADQAAQFGHLYGICCNCGRTLTDETSIAQGYGPVCAQYFI